MKVNYLFTIKQNLLERIKQETELMKGENENLSENQKARRAKKHARNKNQNSEISLDEDIVKFLIIQNALQGVTTAHIHEQKITNAKIAEDVLNESNWSDI